jgi:type IV pilus assembly protein PilW
MSTPMHNYGRCTARRAQAGLSLIELMVALVIGAVLIFGATTVYTNSSKSYGVSESVSRLQETGRFAMSVIETDVRMANYWGLLKGASTIGGQAAQTAAAAAVATSAALTICGTNFAVDLNTSLQGDNDAYILSTGNPLTATRKAGCDTLPDFSSGVAWQTTPVVTADTLTVRHASVIAGGVPGVLQVCTSRVAGRVMSDGGGAAAAIPCAAAPAGQIDNLFVNAYYIDQNSQQRAGLPSLRRKILTSIGGVPQFRDQEIIAGVEDLQIQFGIDPSGTSGVATRYVDPNAVPAGAQIVAVRIWLLVRGDTGENGFTDSRIYQYGDRLQATGVTGNLNSPGGAGLAYRPSASADGSFNGPQHARRLLLSRTIGIRNALGT